MLGWKEWTVRVEWRRARESLVFLLDLDEERERGMKQVGDEKVASAGKEGDDEMIVDL